MFGEKIRELFDIASDLFNEYSVELKNEEDNVYEELNIIQLKALQMSLNFASKKYDLQKYNDYEKCLLDQELIVLNRVINKTNMYLDKIMENDNKNNIFFGDIYIKNNNNLQRISNIYGTFNKFSQKIISQIDMKFMYLLKHDNELPNKEKDIMSWRMLYINPYIEEEIITNNKLLKDCIINNEQNNNKMDELNKYLYNDFIDYYSKEELKNIFDIVLYSKNPDVEVLKFSELYARTILNYLPEDKIKKIEDEFDYIKCINKNINNSRFNYIKNALNSIEKDKELIKKIKN